MAALAEEPRDHDRLITRVVDLLVDDYHRRGGYLSGDHVLRLVEKKGLEPEDDIQVRIELRSRGIDIDDPDGKVDFEGSAAAEESAVQDLVRLYLSEIGEYRLLLPSEEVTLGRRVQAGLSAKAAVANGIASFEPLDIESLERRVGEGQQAEAQMVAANLRLVVSIAKHYDHRTSLELLDLIQEGTLGLLKAVERFDHRKGFKFSTYATWWIRQAITRAIADKGRTIRLPVHVTESLSRISRIRSALIRERPGREPSAVEIAQQLKMKPEKVQFLLDISKEPVSLEGKVGEDGEGLKTFLQDLKCPTPEDLFVVQERLAAVNQAFKDLKRRDSSIIRLRFGLDDGSTQTLELVGERLGVTRERFRLIEAKTIAKLRHPARSAALKPFWPTALDSGGDEIKGKKGVRGRKKKTAGAEGKKTSNDT